MMAKTLFFFFSIKPVEQFLAKGERGYNPIDDQLPPILWKKKKRGTRVSSKFRSSSSSPFDFDGLPLNICTDIIWQQQPELLNAKLPVFPEAHNSLSLSLSLGFILLFSWFFNHSSSFILYWTVAALMFIKHFEICKCILDRCYTQYTVMRNLNRRACNIFVFFKILAIFLKNKTQFPTIFFKFLKCQ
jgi:hypothetical protein